LWSTLSTKDQKASIQLSTNQFPPYLSAISIKKACFEYAHFEVKALQICKRENGGKGINNTEPLIAHIISVFLEKHLFLLFPQVLQNFQTPETPNIEAAKPRKIAFEILPPVVGKIPIFQIKSFHSTKSERKKEIKPLKK